MHRPWYVARRLHTNDTLSKKRHFLLCTFRKAIGNCMCQISLMHRVVQYRAEFHAFQEILPCTIPPCALNLSDTPNLLAYMHIRKYHFFLQWNEPRPRPCIPPWPVPFQWSPPHCKQQKEPQNLVSQAFLPLRLKINLWLKKQFIYCSLMQIVQIYPQA